MRQPLRWIWHLTHYSIFVQKTRTIDPYVPRCPSLHVHCTFIKLRHLIQGLAIKWLPFSGYISCHESRYTCASLILVRIHSTMNNVPKKPLPYHCNGDPIILDEHHFENPFLWLPTHNHQSFEFSHNSLDTSEVSKVMRPLKWSSDRSEFWDSEHDGFCPSPTNDLGRRKKGIASFLQSNFRCILLLYIENSCYHLCTPVTGAKVSEREIFSKTKI